MTQTPHRMTEAPDPFGVVADVLDLVRLGGAIFLHSDFREPWAYTSPPGQDLAATVLPGTKSLCLFHIIGRGHCQIALERDGRPFALREGDVVVMPYGDAHTIGAPPGTPPVSIFDLLPLPPWSTFPTIDHGGDGEHTVVVCGYLGGDALLFDPVLRALPPLFVVHPPAGPAATWVAASVEYAVMASQSFSRASRMTQRLPELLFTEVLRLYLESGDAKVSGWLAALRDPVVGRALALLHADPARTWTVPDLARGVAASRTVLVERFRDLLGRPPIRYLTEWRLSLASGLLRTTQLGVAEIASQVGYESVEAFSRAFKRELGRAPAHWRSDGLLTVQVLPSG